jgi:sec-independent protein translocase protein TatA
MMFGLGVWELTIIFAIVLLLFGGKRLPGVASGLGQAIHNFQAALRGKNNDSSSKQFTKNTPSKIPVQSND